MRDIPNIEAKGKEGKHVPPSVLGDDVPRNNRFYALVATRAKLDEDYVGKYRFFL